jgi:hypothetical protein
MGLAGPAAASQQMKAQSDSPAAQPAAVTANAVAKFAHDGGLAINYKEVLVCNNCLGGIN